LPLHSRELESLEVQYFSISSVVLLGILPTIKELEIQIMLTTNFSHLFPTSLYILMIRVSSSSENLGFTVSTLRDSNCYDKVL